MNFLNFKTYKNKHELEGICVELKRNSITYEIDDNGNSLDANFGNNEFNSSIILKLKSVDFQKANKIIEHLKEQQISIELNESHFLNEFTNDELIDVVKKRDEWGDDNFVLAKNILKSRNINLEQEYLEQLKNERIVELSRPDSFSFEKFKYLKRLGYVSGFLAGPIGFLIGYHLLTFKKVLPNGESVYAYTEEDRKHGRIIIFVGCITSLVFVLIKFLK